MTTFSTPQLSISLSPEGDLLLHLPGASAMGDRRIALREGLTPEGDSRLAQTLRRILRAQSDRRCEIGTDGAPTERQVRHWERHQLFASDQCPFCISEGRTTKAAQSLRHRKTTKLSEYGGVTVRRVAARGKAKAATRAGHSKALGSSMDLGF